ncbi:type II toxin-antitoxin system HipA family toxin [Glaciecola siphonariae]|uniref:Type II toxin-antitoxin system HipA family toxin n=1 Tax=Glaciecola siphonariae TaxID=521012 RepID=A0ABV9LYG6_9ALTE
MSAKAFVFIHGLDEKPVVCGAIKVDESGKHGEFRYGKSYLSRDDAFPLDPLNLPLKREVFTCNAKDGLFGVFTDAGPESWGSKVLRSLEKTKPESKLAVLINSAGTGVGALAFSHSHISPAPTYSEQTFADIPLFLDAKDRLLKNRKIPKAAVNTFKLGASMGGARPKTLLQDEQSGYIVKFNKPDDAFNHVKVEHATMNMLRELDCRVATTATVSFEQGDALLVERFDVKNGVPSSHFLSANSLFNLGKVNNKSLQTQYCYAYLAEFVLEHGGNPPDALDLYKRMIFNVLMGNTDDHARNHGLLYDFALQEWFLAPAYDVLPINASRQHAIGIGDYARDGSLDNLVSQSMRFTLERSDALDIIDTVKELCSTWEHYFKQFGVSDEDIATLKNIIPTFD